MKSWQKYKRKQCCCRSCWKLLTCSAYTIKMIGMLLERCAPSSPQENITKKFNELHNHFTLKILIGQAILP